MRSARWMGVAVVAGAWGWLAAEPAAAHPHVYVTASAEIVFEAGKIAAIQHHWTFDEYYTAMAVQGLDTNNDGIYSREELAELAKVNMEGLQEFEYFTVAKLGAAKLSFAGPQDYWLEHKNGVLTLHFKMPLKEAVASAQATGFELAVYDPSYFIAFELAKGNAVTLAGAPGSCTVKVADMEPAADEKTLTGAMSQQLGTPAGSGIKVARVTCAP